MSAISPSVGVNVHASCSTTSTFVQPFAIAFFCAAGATEAATRGGGDGDRGLKCHQAKVGGVLEARLVLHVDLWGGAQRGREGSRRGRAESHLGLLAEGVAEVDDVDLLEHARVHVVVEHHADVLPGPTAQIHPNQILAPTETRSERREERPAAPQEVLPEFVICGGGSGGRFDAAPCTKDSRK